MGTTSYMYSDRDNKNPDNCIMWEGKFMMKLPEFIGGKHLINKM